MFTLYLQRQLQEKRSFSLGSAGFVSSAGFVVPRSAVLQIRPTPLSLLSSHQKRQMYGLTARQVAISCQVSLQFA